MARWFFTIVCTIITSNFLLAQQNTLEIKGSGAHLFIEHKVSLKESFYSIGRLYNVSPKELASYNNLQFESGLNVGYDLKIPLGKNNFTQTETLKSGEVLVPVYHTVEPQETLYRLGVNYNKVSLASLKKWNQHFSDAVSVGAPMIVGFLKVDKNQSALASQTAMPNAGVVMASKKEENPVEKKAEIIVVKGAETIKTENENVSAGQTNEPKVAVTTINTKSDINFSGGYFKKLFDQQTEKQSPLNDNGTASVFKSTSGWRDGKYYCFNNEATPGTILKVTDNATGKSVYAKVLDAIPDIKQNEGLAIVISNAAAEELGSGENKFTCSLSYVK